MKQKNLILMVVAVGCGLLAAFLTSQMSAKPAEATKQIEVLVVAKELAPGTKFTIDSIKDQFKKKMMNPDALPEKAVFSEEGLDGKTLNKTLRADDFLREADLGNYQPLDPPEGKHIITVRMPVDKMTPFVQPNSKVDIMGTGLTKDNKVKSTILIPNMLVMAVDTRITTPNGNAVGGMDHQMASIAVSPDEAMAIRVAEMANVKLSFILRSDRGSEDKTWSLSKVINWINGEDTSVASTDPSKAPATTDKTTGDTTKITVPSCDLPAGTELTKEVVESKFKELVWTGAAPANAVVNIKEHVGRFLVKDIAAEQFVPKSYVNDKPPEVAAAPRVKGGEGSDPGTKPELPAPAKKLATFDRTFTSTQGIKTYRYQLQENGELKMLGEVTSEGAVVPATNVPPAAAAPKQEAPPTKRDI